MRSLVIAAALAAFSCVALSTAASAGDNTRIINVGAGQTQQRITLALDKAAIVQLDKDARDVLVSNPDIVDAVVRTPRRIFLLAQKTGQTNAFFFDASGKQILSIDIRVEKDVADLAGLIRANMPGSGIKVSALNDNVVLTGNVSSAAESSRAQDLAARFAGSPDKVVNMIKINAREQVMLRVRVAEVQREVAKQFGIDIAAAVRTAGMPIIASTSNPFSLLGRALADASGIQLGSIGSDPMHPGPNNIQGIVKALEQVGLMHTLAEPNLTAVSGETAKFLAGGEFPVPASRDRDGNVTVAFKQFGVGLSFTPVVMNENRISLQISTEVSELTNTGAFILNGSSSTDPTTGVTTTAGGLTIPALAVRRAETTVELPSGGSFAIAGLLSHTTKQQLDAFPGLKDMPILGALFKSRDYQNNETELVVMVSAYLVDPTHETKIALPTDGFVPPADVDTILLNRLNTVHDKPDPNGLKSAADTKVGFIVQ